MDKLIITITNMPNLQSLIEDVRKQTAEKHGLTVPSGDLVVDYQDVKGIVGAADILFESLSSIIALSMAKEVNAKYP